MCKIKWFLVNLQSYATIATNLKIFVTLKRSLILDLQSVSVPVPNRGQPLCRLSAFAGLPFLGVLWNHSKCSFLCVASFTWHKGFQDVSRQSTYDALVLLWSYSLVQIRHIWFSHSAVEGHLVRSHFMTMCVMALQTLEWKSLYGRIWFLVLG